MTRHPASASRVAVTGLSLAGTLLAAAGFSYQAQAEEADKAREQAAAMRRWNRQQAAQARQARRWAETHPLVVTRTVYRKVYVAGGSPGAAATRGAGSPSTGGAPAGGSSAPAPAAAPAAPAPAAPPPAATSGGS